MLNTHLQNTAEFMSGRGTSLILLSAIIIGSVMGNIAPQTAQSMTGLIDHTILLLVFLLLFDVRIKNLVSSLNRIGFIMAALIINFMIIPVLGFAISKLFLSSHPLFFIGLVIYFMAPCTDWFLGFTRLAKGNTALGAALLPINMIIQFLLYPVYLHIFGIETTGSAGSDIFHTLWQWFLIPLIAALALRFVLEKLLSEKQMELILTVTTLLIPVLLAVLVGQISAVNIGTLIAHASVFPVILGAIWVFFILTYFLSEVISKIMTLPYEDRVLLTMTTAARNAPLMLAITIAVIPDQPIIYAAIIMGMLVELPHLVALKMILLRQCGNT